MMHSLDAYENVIVSSFAGKGKLSTFQSVKKNVFIPRTFCKVWPLLGIQ